MFYRDENGTGDSLRSELRDRLRAALDFATLGAYEELHDQPRRQPVPKRVLMFSRVEAPCPHSKPLDREPCAPRDRRRPRRPASAIPEQPCLWALDRAGVKRSQ